MILKHLAAAARQQHLLRASVLACRHMRDRAVDRWLGISTEPGGARPPHNANGDSYACDPIEYPLALQLLRTAELRPDDVVYDIGCGMGRIVCMAARRPVQRCVGVEISQTLAEAARNNAMRMRGRRAPIDILLADAARADYSDGTVFFLFNPFGEDTLRQVLHHIEESLAAHPRDIRIGYGKPMHEDVLQQCAWLQRYATYRSPWYERPSSFWRSRPFVHEESMAADQQPTLVEPIEVFAEAAA